MNYQDFKAHFRLTYPIIFGQLSYIITIVTDNIMIGHIGTAQFAAEGLSNSITWPLFALGLGISQGIIPLVADADARKQYKKATTILQHALSINLGYGLFACILVLLLSPIIHYLGQDKEVVTLAIPYMVIIAISLIPFMILQTFKEYTSSLSFTKDAMYITILDSVLNIGFNYLLIYGCCWLPAMGLIGAGIAALLSRVISAGLMIAYIYWKPQIRSCIVDLQFKRFFSTYTYKLLQIGIPAGVESALNEIVYSICTIMVGWIGAHELSGYTISSNINYVSWMMMGGVGVATTIRVGNQFGRRDFRAIRRVGHVGFIIGGGIALLVSIIFIAGYKVIPSYYNPDPVVRQISGTLLLISALFQLSDSVNIVCASILRGIKDTIIPCYITIIINWCIGIPLAYTFAFTFKWGVCGILYALGAGQIISGILMYIRFNKKTKK